jgi:flagellar basal body-associated protein FliL
MLVLGTVAASTDTTRLVLLLLVLLAVVLILSGSIIALVTLRKRVKAQNSHGDSAQLESKRT